MLAMQKTRTFACMMLMVSTSAFAVTDSSSDPQDQDEMDSQEVMHFAKGLKLPENWKNGANFVTQSPFTMKGALPASFDWRTQPGGLTAVQNQGECGSCWAFSTSATFADAILVKDHQTRNLSQQYLVSCDSHGWNCDGGFWAFDMFEEQGAVYGSDLPYTGTNGSCPSNLPRHEKVANWAYIGAPEQLTPDVNEIKRTIMEFGPVSVAVNATMAMQFYFGGTFSSCETTTYNDLNHAVNLVGWNDAGGYWIMRNSWGKNWGDHGYMKIKYGCNGIGAAASYVNYKPACSPQPFAKAGPDHTIKAGESVQIGSTTLQGSNFQWAPAEGLDDPTSATPTVKPTETTMYVVTVKNECGTAASQVQVNVTP